MKKSYISTFTMLLCFFAIDIFAAGDTSDLKGMADNLRGNFNAIAELMVSVAYVAGIGFGITAIFKFKQHKDNPTQVPIGTPFAMLVISVLLIFLPAIYSPAGKSIFGDNAEAGGTGDNLNLPAGGSSQ